MIRTLHRWPALLGLIPVIILALSGAALSVLPAAEHLAAPQTEAGLTVADLSQRIKAAYPGVEQIKRAPSGQITAYWFADGTPGSAVIDPATGQAVASADPNQTERWLTDLHRSLFLGDAGRIVTASAAAAMVILAVSGAFLVARRLGGWRRWFSRLRGPMSGRLHVEFARVAVFGMLFSALTALWMTASTFDLLPDAEASPVLQTQVSGKTGIAPAAIDLLARTPVSVFRDLSFPYPDDPTDVFTLTTDSGIGLLDQGNGALVAWADLTIWQRISETVYMLHTGQGAAVLGLVLGAMALAVPVLATTGAILWGAGQRNRPRIRGNVAANRAETILLVGSEAGSTWGFAATLHRALTAAGQTVHAAPMNHFDPRLYGRARQILVLAATYGDGDAPASATGFMDRLAASDRLPQASLGVLGFGDRNYPTYCQFAQDVQTEATAKGWTLLLPLDSVDRQSPQDFARWGRALGQAMGITLDLAHQRILPRSQSLTLLSRRDHGAEVQAPTVILRFAVPKVPIWARWVGGGFGRFQAGDLLGICPQGSSVPRFYSLASGTKDGFIEIVVRKQSGGLCSGQLIELQPGESVAGFLRPNPRFHAGRDRQALILIGAGTGIGPLAGFVRSNSQHRPIHLFFGMRHQDSDFMYGDDLAGWQDQGHLTRLVTAVSRGSKPHYVQDALRNEAAVVARLIREGARVMVCGGRDMAAGVTLALADILGPMGPTPAMLKAEGRYVEDVY